MQVYVVPSAGFSRVLRQMILDAEDGDTLECPSVSIQSLAMSTKLHHCPGKQLSITLSAEAARMYRDTVPHDHHNDLLSFATKGPQHEWLQ